MRSARRVALLGGGAALAGLALVGLLLLLGLRGEEAARIEARYGPLLVPVAAHRRRLLETAVDLESFAALARLAERYERLILHERAGELHSY